MLILHIVLALGSVVMISYAAWQRSSLALYFTYVLTVGVVVSGVWLGFIMPAKVGHLCVSGFVYLVGMVMAVKSVRQKLAFIKIT